MGCLKLTYHPTEAPEQNWNIFVQGSEKSQGNQKKCFNYYPYGKVLREYTLGVQDRYLSTYNERDQATGYDYRGARFYDSEVGRFLSLDPLAMEFAEWSDYNYVLGNPVLLTDQTGNCPQCVPYLVGIGIVIYATVGGETAEAPSLNPESDKKLMAQSKKIQEYARKIGLTFIIAARAAGEFDTDQPDKNQPNSPEKKVPNPNGKNGGPAHQEKVNEVVKDMEGRGLQTQKEEKVNTPNGKKGYRYTDATGTDENGNVVERHQVGKQNKNGTPIKRERDAIKDIQDATGLPVNFHPYNTPLNNQYQHIIPYNH